MLVRHLSWAKLLEKDKVPQQGPLLMVCGEHGPQQGLEMVSERWMGEEATVVFSRRHVGDGVKNRRGTNQGDTERFYSRTLYFFFFCFHWFLLLFHSMVPFKIVQSLYADK